MKTKLYVSSLLVLLLAACADSRQNNVTLAVESAILGGKETPPSNVVSKYIVLVFDNITKNYCTGVLLKKDVILTAAHCVGKNAEDLTLAFGLKPLAGDYTTREALKILSHELYKKPLSGDRSDIALIRIKGEAPEGYTIAELPDDSFPIQKGLIFTAIGYGRTSGKKAPPEDIQGSGYLRQVDLEIESLSSSEFQFYIDQTSGKGICKGDSGGPALMRYLDKDFVVGIASAITWTSAEDVCTEKSIYMNVKKYRPWIEQGLKQLAN